MKIFTSVAAGVLLLGVSQAAAATLTIDSFITNQSTADQPTGTQPTNSEVAAGEALGGFRDLYVITDGTQEADTVLRSGIVDGQLSFSNQANISGQAFVTYDGGDGDATTVDTSGLGGLNLNIGPQAGFQFEVISLDITGGLIAGINVWDTLGNFGAFDGPVSEGGDTFVPFTAFGDVDFSTVGAIQFFAQSDDDVDAIIGPITVSAIPLPASALLLLGGIGGLSAFSMRRRKNS